MRIKVDENLPEEVAELLRETGHDAESVLEEGLAGFPDEAVYAAAIRENRVLLTFDTDFSSAVLYPPGASPGVVVLRLEDQAKPVVLSLIVELSRRWHEQPVEKETWIVEPHRIRIRGS